jgi:hypothetical protein
MTFRLGTHLRFYSGTLVHLTVQFKYDSSKVKINNLENETIHNRLGVQIFRECQPTKLVEICQ